MYLDIEDSTISILIFISVHKSIIFSRYNTEISESFRLKELELKNNNYIKFLIKLNYR